MSNAVEKIVQLNDSRALGDLRRYRQELAILLKAQTCLDFSLLIGQIDAEIAVITAYDRHSIQFCWGLPLLQPGQAGDVQQDRFGWDHLKRLAAN